MNELDKVKIKWPLVYTMFCTIFLYRKELSKNPLMVTNQIRVRYTASEKAWYLLTNRTQDIRAFLHTYGARDLAMLLTLYLRTLEVKNKKAAAQVFFTRKEFKNIVSGSLEAALRTYLKTDTLDVAQDNILSKPHLTIIRNGTILTQIEMSNTDKSWVKFHNIKRLAL